MSRAFTTLRSPAVALPATVIFLALALSGCKKDPQPSPPVVGQAPAAAPAQTAPAPQAPAAIQKPVVRQFSPSVDDVTAAFETALLKTVMSVPESPARDAWFNTEYQRLRTLKVSQCTSAVIGQPVACRVEFSGHVLDVKLLLTQEGWLLIK